jgi:hypothetical protein
MVVEVVGSSFGIAPNYIVNEVLFAKPTESGGICERNNTLTKNLLGGGIKPEKYATRN